jgi:putative membrane protein
MAGWPQDGLCRADFNPSPGQAALSLDAAVPGSGLVSTTLVNHREAAFVSNWTDNQAEPDKSPPESPWKRFFQRWVINTLAVLVAVYIVDGIDYQKWPDLLVASLLLGVLNTFLRPLLMLLSLPLLLFTLGLFMLVINALTLLLVGWLLSPRFTVDGFWSAFWGALIISVVGLVLNIMTGAGNAKMEFRRGRRGQRPSPEDRGGGGGPVIDV